MTSQVGFFVDCSRCGKSIGELTYDEWATLWGECGAEVLCFDCSPYAADKVPGLFDGWQSGDVFVIGDSDFEISGNTYPEKPVLLPLSRAHAHTPAVCLSSSTYLNTSSNPKRERDQNTGNDAKCLHDTLVGHPFVVGLWTCEQCGWQLQEDESIILPSWVIERGDDCNPPSPIMPECPDCIALRLFNRANYCDYHHALLIEQSEDGSLGYGNG